MRRDIIQEGNDAVEYAASVRAYHARRTRRGAAQREEDIKIALDRLKRAMKPVRSEIAAYPYKPLREANAADRAEMQSLSRAIQRERRKLWKMQVRSK